MILKSLKVAVLTGAGLLLAGGLVFGTDLLSYAKSSAYSVRSAVKDSVPVEFELKRARDLLDEIVPEMHANIKLIAQQEVEIAGLKKDLAASEKSLAEEQARVQKLRESLLTSQVAFTVGGVTYNREQVKEELGRRFDRYKEAEVVLASKKRLLDNRERTLAASVQTIERTRSQKALLENQIAALESQFRLIQAASVGSSNSIDHSKLAQTEKLISQVKKQLDVAERVLAHEAKFIQPMNIDVVDEKHLLAEVEEHFSSQRESAQTPLEVTPQASR